MRWLVAILSGNWMGDRGCCVDLVIHLAYNDLQPLIRHLTFWPTKKIVPFSELSTYHSVCNSGGTLLFSPVCWRRSRQQLDVARQPKSFSFPFIYTKGEVGLKGKKSSYPPFTAHSLSLSGFFIHAYYRDAEASMLYRLKRNHVLIFQLLGSPRIVEQPHW